MEKMLSSFDGTMLYTKVEVPEGAKAVAVIVHGLCEHQGRYDYFAEMFHAAGVGTYRFDHRGHGRSEGERTYYGSFHELLDDTNVIVDMAIAENPEIPVFLIGHSMGGYTVALYGAKYTDKKLRGIITSGALIRDHAQLIANIPTDLDEHFMLPNELGAGVCSVAEVVEWYALDPYNTKTFTVGLCNALNAGIVWMSEKIADFKYPVLMLHGQNDGLVSYKDTYDLFDLSSSEDKQMKIYGGLFHEIFNEYCKDEVIGDALAWLLKRI